MDETIEKVAAEIRVAFNSTLEEFIRAPADQNIFASMAAAIDQTIREFKHAGLIQPGHNVWYYLAFDPFAKTVQVVPRDLYSGIVLQFMLGGITQLRGPFPSPESIEGGWTDLAGNFWSFKDGTLSVNKATGSKEEPT